MLVQFLGIFSAAPSFFIFSFFPHFLQNPKPFSLLNASAWSSTALMAFVSRFPSTSCSSRNLCVFRFSLGVGEPPRQIRLGALRFLHCQEMASASSTPGKNFRVGTRIRAKKSVKSNEELCNDLREFVSMVGLPEGHVPSFKELAEHGRKDLANIVRRRGYRLIKELIMGANKEDTIAEISSAENYEANDGYEDESVECRGQGGNKLADGLSSSTEVSDMENYSSSTNGVLHSVIQTESLESSTDSSLREKAAKFVQDGELEIVEARGNGSNIGYDISNANDQNLGESDLELDVESGLSLPPEKRSHDEVTADDTTLAVNARALTSKMDAPLGMGHTAHREDFSSAEGNEVNERDHEVEISQLKSMLHQKELELSQLKEQIEKEKLALATLQAKAEREIGKAQAILLAKDEELRAAEESFSGLKEVQLEYWGDGETVEMAGSFNGWHDRIKMDSHPPSSSLNLTESRQSKLWSTVLWLYPGIYEIKFIVDGHWRIDPRRESVTRGTIHNNILRVDR